jgi:purine-binding chemotaxis protein CheW
MSKKRKLESSLEGLFSKSKEKDKPKEKSQDEFIPTHPGGQIKKDKSGGEQDQIPEADPNLVVKTAKIKTGEKSAPRAKTVKTPSAKTDPTPEPTSRAAVEPQSSPKIEPAHVLESPASNPVQPVKPVNKDPEPPMEPVMHPEPEVIPEFGPVETSLVKTSAVSQVLAVVENEKEEEKQLLIFRIGEVDYAVEVELVQTIIKPQTVFLVPGTDEFVKGLINLRGEVVPVVDLHIRFNLPPQEINKLTRFVVIEIGELRASLVVDAVQGVVTIPLNVIEKPSNVVSDIETRYLKGIARLENQLVLILDLGQTIRIATEN